MSLVLLALACTPTGGLDSASPELGPQAVLATVSMDFATGALASVSLEDGSIQDLLAPVSGDAVVRTVGEEVLVLNRFGYDNLRFYAPGQWSAPRLEVGVGDGEGPTNPVDTAICGEDLLVLLYERDHALFLSPTTGAVTGTLDLSPWVDGDGQSPEAGSIAAWEGRLYLGLERLDRSAGWIDAGGFVLEVDCEARAITREWEGPANTNVEGWPEGDGLLVRGRAWGERAGGVYRFDPEQGLSPLVEVVEGEVAGIAAVGSDLIYTTLAEDNSSYGIHCADLSTGQSREVDRRTEYLADIAASPTGEAWIAAHWGWNDPEGSSPGVFRWDIASCEPIEPDQPLQFSLAPSSIAFP